MSKHNLLDLLDDTWTIRIPIICQRCPCNYVQEIYPLNFNAYRIKNTIDGTIKSFSYLENDINI